jgi:hypothetical protein
MTRTHIIAADGTRFVQQGQGKILARRVIAAALLIITALFLSAAVIGFQRAAIAPSTLHEGDKITIDTNCWAGASDEARTLIIHCD